MKTMTKKVSSPGLKKAIGRYISAIESALIFAVCRQRKMKPRDVAKAFRPRLGWLGWAWLGSAGLGSGLGRRWCCLPGDDLRQT